jgi:hypothetical protein
MGMTNIPKTQLHGKYGGQLRRLFRVKECAEGILADLDSAIQNQEAIAGKWKKR